jgi:hypothetical protein
MSRKDMKNTNESKNENETKNIQQAGFPDGHPL